MVDSTHSLETATLGGGCFWCLDAVYRGIKGVTKVESGYTGGTLANPSYDQVCSGRTGHAEVVRLTFDPSVISFRELLDIFFVIHDPTTLNRQGGDVGTQYRSVIFYHDDTQRAVAEDSGFALAHYRLASWRRASGTMTGSSPSSRRRRRSSSPSRTTRTTSRRTQVRAIAAP